MRRLLLLVVALTVGSISSAFALDSAIRTLKVERGLTPEGQKCIECHAQKQPGIVSDWANSRHGHVNVSCIDCHGVEKGYPMASQNCAGVRGTETYISVVVTPKTCGRCHSAEVDQFSKSGHARASIQYHSPDGKNFKSMTALIAKYEGQGIEKFKDTSDMAGCMQCHGSDVKVDASGRPLKETWPAAGIGTTYPDGSVGNCVVCHTRHRFNIAEARKPAACASCHLGPDHPDIEIYNNSKHGHVFNAEGSTWNFSSAPDAWEPGDFRAPTCAVCHMSGIGALTTTHNISERLKWNLWLPESAVRNSPDPLSPLTGEGVAGREKMMTVCSNCHSSLHTENFFEAVDLNVELYNEAYWKPALALQKELADKKLLKENPWDDEFQKVIYHLWHHEGRRMRQGGAMGGPDYAHWHGVFEVQQDLYKLKSIAENRIKNGKIED